MKEKKDKLSIYTYNNYRYKSQNKNHGYQTLARPTASLTFCQLSAFGLTNHTSYCMLESECNYNGLVYFKRVLRVQWKWIK